MNTNNIKKPSVRTVAWVLAIAYTVADCAIPISYISYAYTDLALIPVGLTGISNFLVTVLGVIAALTVGAIIAKTKTRFGQCRPYILGSYIAMEVGAIVMFAAGAGGGTMTRTIVITIGFGLMTIGNAILLAAIYGLERIVAGVDSDARNLMASRFMLGLNAGMVLSGAIVIPIANFFGGGVKGYSLMQILLAIVGLIGVIALFKVTKLYDLPNAEGDAEEENVRFLDMIKSAVINRTAMTVFFSDVSRMFGYCMWFALIVYQCKYVIGDMNSMVIVLTSTNLLGILGAYLSFPAAKIFGGRKKLALVACVLTMVSFLGIALFGGTLVGFVAFGCAACFFMSFYDSICPMMYADAGEYWLYKTGKDTRVYLMSLAALPMQVAMALSSLGFTGVLMLINYVPDTEISAETAKTLTWTVGLVPAICYVVSIVLLLFVHGISDKEMERYCKENEKAGLGMEMDL